jgi:hypothetical protein
MYVPSSIAVAGRVVQRMQFLQVAHLFESWRKTHHGD